ncbi:MAG: ATP-grasp domain-containing protein [Betaproteobacteria bacterium]|nr:ATP-grasp domain-containing protein [Betaproteobacteria bacterium]
MADPHPDVPLGAGGVGRGFRSLLIANRGEIALRVMQTARRLGLRTIAVYSEADRDARHAREADAAACIGPAAPRESYLKIEALLAAAARTGAQALHPGYGFLAESADFAQAVLDARLIWVGPPPSAIRAMGDKGEAKRLMQAAGVPVLPTYEDGDEAEFPLMVKAAAGGGGRGMRLVRSRAELAHALAQARSEAEHAFGDGRLLLERALEGARHVEVQVFADAHGDCIHLGERDCSVQRRHQKLIEESPSPAVNADLRASMGEAAVAAARAVGYVGAGTVEFLLGADGRFWFMEMNTRLQVEHAVTEALTGLDLVEWQLRVAAGEPLPLAQQDVRLDGHAMEARLCAEDPAREFLPQSGKLAFWRSAEGVRVDHALETGIEVPPFYDSMIAKLIAHAATRDAAREKLARALDETIALGLPTNKSFLAAVLRDEVFARGEAKTEFLAERTIALPQPGAAEFAIAAVLLAESTGYGDWASWSNTPARSMHLKLEDAEIALRFEHGRYRAAVGRDEIAVRLLARAGASEARLEVGECAEETVAYCVEGEAIHIACAAGSLSFRNRSHAPSARRSASVGDGRLSAPMNGRVVAVHAKEGERFAAGSPLVVLEAMKMEHGLSLPAAVKIKAVHVAAGAQVAPGHMLLEFEPA